MLRPEQKKTRRGYYAWECNWGNIFSESKTSPEKALRNLVKHLRNSGYNIEEIKERIRKIYGDMKGKRHENTYTKSSGNNRELGSRTVKHGDSGGSNRAF